MSLESEIGDGDANGDGKTSLSELATVVRTLSDHQAASDSDNERITIELDDDGNGLIDLQSSSPSTR